MGSKQTQAEQRLAYARKIMERRQWPVPDSALVLLRDLQVLPGIRDRSSDLLATLRAHQQDAWLTPNALCSAVKQARGLLVGLPDMLHDIGILLDVLEFAPTLTAPKTPDWWNGDPDFAGLVPREEQDKDMLLAITPWANGSPVADEFDTLIFEWKAAQSSVWEEVQRDQFPGPTTPGGPDKQVTLNKDVFREHGTYDLRYRLETWQGIEQESFPTSVRIDKRPPHYSGQAPDDPVFDAGVTDGITEAYLAANGDVVELTIPAYDDEQLGDTVQVYISTSSTPVANPVFDGALLTGRTVTIPGAALRLLQDGLLLVNYRLTDKVGNRGAHSEDVQASLLLRPEPADIAAPIVELAETDGLIDLDDVRTTTRLVGIPLYRNWQENDSILVTWGSVQLSTPTRVGGTPANPIIIDIPFSDVLQRDYGDVTVGPKDTAISYEVRRGLRPFPAPQLDIKVDLSVPGPVNPGRPDPINPLLPELNVYGSTDTGDARPNKLVAADKGLAATVKLLLYTPIAAGEQLWFYWGTKDNEIGTYTPALGDEGNPIEVPVAWDVIESFPGSDKVPVFYEIGLAAGGNREQSKVAEVDVLDALPVVLADPEYPDAGRTSSGRPILNCTSFKEDPNDPTDHFVRVRFPADPAHLKADDVVDIVFQGFTDSAGTTPLPDDFKVSRTLSAADVATGFTIEVNEYDTNIKPIGLYGLVTVTYSVQGSTAAGNSSILASTMNAGGPCFGLFVAGNCACACGKRR